MMAINFNTIGDYHWNINDKINSLFVLVALENFKGGELYFPQLKVIVPLRLG